MSDYIEYNGKIAFHPGYYINECIEASGLTQNDFAKRLGTTPKNLSILVRGNQDLSYDMAMKLSRMLGTSIEYWLNLQSAYDALLAEFDSEKELEKERRVFGFLDYKYFRTNFSLPDLPRRKDEQIAQVRRFLGVASLSVLSHRDMAVSFRSSSGDMAEGSIIKANVMVQIAANIALRKEAPSYDRERFRKAIGYALTQTTAHDSFYPRLCDAFLEAGVIFVVLPNIPGSRTNGATKKIGNHIMLMVNDRRSNSDTFWFTLFHEIGHIINGDYGISFEDESGDMEAAADSFAQDALIPPEEYRQFREGDRFDLQAIKSFAASIGRDPSIVLGRLQNDGIIGFDDWSMNSLRHRYRIRMAY